MIDGVCKLLIVSAGTFDVLGLKRVFTRRHVPCELLMAASRDEMEQVLSVQEGGVSAVLVDYARDSGNLAAECTQYVEAESMLPVIGIFDDGCETDIAKELSAGVASYVVRNDRGEYFDILYVLIQDAMARKGQIDKTARFREQINAFRREREAMLNASLTLLTWHLPDTRIVWSNAFDGDKDDGTDSERDAIDYLAGRYCKEIWKHGGLPNGRCPVATSVETREPVEAEVMTLDGYAMLQRAYPVKNESGKVTGVMVSTLDMTAVSPAQEAMRTAARIQASATLAGGIAHKFNNLMSGVMGNVSLALHDLEDTHPAAECLWEIEQAAAEAGELSEQLLAFARGGKYLPRSLDVNQVVTEVMQTERRRIPDGIEVEQRLGTDMWQVEANAAQIGLLITQVLLNSAEAIESRYGTQPTGRIVIATRNEVVEGAAISARPWLTDGNYVVLEISDNGCGMSPDIRKKIFEPFFTTKKKGRGLGLAGAYGIVRSHEGHIVVDSVLEEGTRVVVYLPALNVEALPVEPVQTETSPRGQVVSLTRGHETVLIVDDEAMLRKALKRLLERLGYTVLSASSGDDAVSIASDYRGTIDLALLDMIMPGLDGMEAYRQLKGLYPKMDILVMSGYDKDTYAEAFINAGAAAFFQKPVSMSVLATEIRTVLDRRK